MEAASLCAKTAFFARGDGDQRKPVAVVCKNAVFEKAHSGQPGDGETVRHVYGNFPAGATPKKSKSL